MGANCLVAGGASKKTLVLEIKDKDSEQHRAIRVELDEWGKAVNENGGFGYGAAT